MKNWFLKLRIRLKLLLAFGSILMMSVLLTLIGINTIRKVINYNDLTERIQGFNVSTLEMSRYIQEFADRGFKNETFLKHNESEWITAYQDEYERLESQSDSLSDHVFFENEKNRKSYDSLTILLAKYDNQVKQLLNLYQERGFKDYGIEGKLRAAIHDVEDANFPYDKATMLMLRRHEKDFFLRKDLKYLNRFNNTIDEFSAQIDTVTSDSGMKSEILASVGNYKTQFNYIVELEQKIGLTTHAGTLGNLNSTYKQIESVLGFLTREIKDENTRIVNRSMILLLSLLVFQIVIGFVLIVFYANLLTKAIREIKSALVSLSKGAFPEELTTRTKDEIAAAKIALNQLVERIKAAVKFSTDLGKGNLKIEYDERYNDDVLSSAIIKMKDQLVIADEKQSAVNWTNEGMARFGEILKNESDSLEKLGDDITRQMVKYLNINQGALYILDEESNELDRISTFAYHKKKFVDQKVSVGQGLVGQCVLEKDYIHITDVPDNFIKITSGLGEATASNILIVPLMIRERVMGVIELASFKPFTEQMIKFTLKVSENIANILASKSTAEHTKILLEEAQHKAEKLNAQEEELRQNAEEMQATQEEMQRQRGEMEQQIEELKLMLQKKNDEITNLTETLNKEKNHREILEEMV